MDSCLIAFSLLEPGNWWIILQVAAGLGMVIFVHELGHFAVAKACGVKCEKFYLGFDIGGYKIAKFQWGETEYGIGILPLGGYVKMLGQDDNPSRAADELERSKLATADSTATEAAGMADSDLPVSGADHGATHAVAFDQRSYMAKSVPQRMAIISAGVIMNVIFAFIIASIAYSMGVRYAESTVLGTAPDSPAWHAGLQPGDKIVEIEGIKKPRFDLDMMPRVAVANLEKGVDLRIDRAGKEFDLNIKPSLAGETGRPTIGVVPARSATIRLMDGPAAKAEPKLQAYDVVVSVAGQPVQNSADIDRVFAEHRSEPVTLTVERPSTESDQAGDSLPAKEVTATVPPNPLRVLGLQMEIGPVVAIREDSPASKSGLRRDDVIVAVDGAAVGDPMTLADRVRTHVGESVTITVQRPDVKDPLDLTMTPVAVKGPDVQIPGAPASIPELGIAFRVTNTIAQIAPDSPAIKAGIKPGDEIAVVDLVLPQTTSKEKEAAAEVGPIKIQFTGDDGSPDNWPAVFAMLQNCPAKTTVRVFTTNGKSATLTPTVSDDLFIVDRGFAFDPYGGVRKAENLSEAMSLGLQETRHQMLQVYWFLQKLVSGQLSSKLLGGPLTIASQAGASASMGTPQLLLFLCMLSANLAVINFLPIPVLDGGHMVFLILEGIRGKPVSERVIVAFHYAGLIFILSLMVFVLTLDANRFMGG